MASTGSNLGPTSKKLNQILQERIEAYRLENNLDPTIPIPSDAICASASGLDPDISIANAYLQAPRIAIARNMTPPIIKNAIRKATVHRWLGVFGQPHVNILQLNLLLDRLQNGNIGNEGQMVGGKLPIKRVG